MMTDTKQEALRQALAYHCSGYSANKSASPDQVVATARKFEAFLDGKNEKRMHSLSSR